MKSYKLPVLRAKSLWCSSFSSSSLSLDLSIRCNGAPCQTLSQPFSAILTALPDAFLQLRIPGGEKTLCCVWMRVDWCRVIGKPVCDERFVFRREAGVHSHSSVQTTWKYCSGLFSEDILYAPPRMVDRATACLVLDDVHAKRSSKARLNFLATSISLHSKVAHDSPLELLLYLCQAKLNRRGPKIQSVSICARAFI